MRRGVGGTGAGGTMERVWGGLGIGAALGALAGAVVALVLRTATSLDVSWLYVVTLAALIGAVIGGGVALTVIDREPYRLAEWAPLRPETVLRQVTRRYREAGWAVRDTGDTAMTFTRQGRPNAGITVLLLLAAIVPGVVYWFAVHRTLVASVVAAPVPDGSEVEIAVNQGGDGARPVAVACFNSLHELVSEPSNGRADRV